MKKINIFLLGIISLFIGINVNALSLVNDNVDIYAIPVTYKDKVSIPDNLKQSYKIEIEGATGAPTFYTNYTDSIEISEDGVITPKKTVWYCTSNICSTSPIQGYTRTNEQYDFRNDIIVKVRVDGKELEQKINLINYAFKYSEDYMNNYLNDNIKDDMTEYEKMKVIAKFVASYPYSATSTSYVGFILGSGGDCIASANTIVYMAEKVGIKAHVRYAVLDIGSGNNHHNVAAVLDGELYVIEAGYNMSTPRMYDIVISNNGLSYYSSEFYQYDGYDEILNIPTLKNTNGDLKNMKIGKMLLYYGEHAGTKVHTVNVPSSVTTIAGGAFSGVATLKNINLDENENYKVIDNVLYTKDGSTLVSYPAGKEDSTFTISDGVKKIDEFSFIISPNLKKVIIPNSVTTIGRRAFMGGKLSEVIIGNGVTTIEDEAFYNNKFAGEVIIPSSVKTIGIEAFDMNNNLNSIIIYSKDVELGKEFVPRRTTIIAYENSTAHAYALENGNKFIALTDENTKALTSDMISGLKDNIDYDGINKLNIVIKDGDYTLIENKDYTLEYSNNTIAGKASVVITGIGNYVGYYNFDYTINAKKIEYNIKSTTIKYTTSKLDITTNIPDDIKATIYYGDPNNKSFLSSAIPYKDIGEYQLRVRISAPNYETVDEIVNLKIEPCDVNDLKTSFDNYEPSYNYTGSGIMPYIYLYHNSSSLKQDKDYTVEYVNNINAGTASIKVNGIGNYTGTLIRTFKINPIKISDVKKEGLVSSYKYVGSEIIQNIKLTYNNKELIKDKDYTINYKNNKNVGKASIVITGKDNYAGEYTYNFNITSVSIKDLEFSELKNIKYTGNEIKPLITIKNKNNTLEEGIDYKISYKNNINIGTASIIITGINNYSGSITKTFKITGDEISNCLISNIANQIYTGKNITPNVIVTDGDITLVKNKDYTISYKNNKNVGTATITIKGIGKYTGTITKSFKIVVDKPSNLTAGKQDKSSISLKWSKPKGSITGYQIYYSTKKDSGYKLLTTITKVSTTSYKKTKLSSNKVYYFKVRSYKTISNKKYYSSYTDVMSTSTATASPSIKVSSNANSSTITWKKVSGATSYEVYQSTDKKKYAKVGITTSLSYKVEKLDSAKTYYYKVRAVKTHNNINIRSSFSKVVSTTTKPVNPVVTVSTSGSSATIKWNKVTRASGYEIYQSTDGKKYTKIKTITKGSTISYKKTKLTSAKGYYYKVRAYKKVGSKKVYSSYTTVLAITTPDTPSIKLTTKDNSITISWNKINCTGYEVYISDSIDGEYTLVNDITNNKVLSITKEELESDKIYYVKVRSYKKILDTKKYSSYSKIISIKVK